jgi:hypothetical protein
VLDLVTSIRPCIITCYAPLSYEKAATRQQSPTGRMHSFAFPESEISSAWQTHGSLTQQLWRETVRTNARWAACPTVLLAWPSSLLTIRTLGDGTCCIERPWRDRIGSGMDDGSGIGIGAKPSSWVFDFHGVLLSAPCLRLRSFKLFLAFEMLQ